MTEIFDIFIVIIASLISGILVHIYDKNHDNKLDEEEIKEGIIELTKKK